eukprot:4666759-Heterocapsa_arctica.AAC.1
MTSRTPSRGEVPANRSGLGPVLNSFATHRDLIFGLGRGAIVRVRQSSFDGGFARLRPASGSRDSD